MANHDDDREKAKLLEGMLMDSMHAMRSMEEVEKVESVEKAGKAEKNAKTGQDAEQPGAPEPEAESLVDRIAGFTGSALRFAARSTDTSRKVGRVLMNSQDQLRMMLAAGNSLRDIREVAGLTLSEMSEALNLKDKSVLEAIENGTSTLSFELILRLAALIARNDPIPFILRTTRNYNPEVWRTLDGWGVGRLPLQFERERQFINIFRSHDDARTLSDEGFQKVLEFTRQSFEMSLHFIEQQERELAEIKASKTPDTDSKTE